MVCPDCGEPEPPFGADVWLAAHRSITHQIPRGLVCKTTGDPDPDVDPERAYEPLTQNQAQELFRQVGLLP